jgi:hypothetical protein
MFKCFKVSIVLLLENKIEIVFTKINNKTGAQPPSPLERD